MLKVLLLNNRVPYPLRDGGAKASHSLIKGLAAGGVQVDCIFLNTQKHFLPESEIKKQFDFTRLVQSVSVDTQVTVKGAILGLLSGKSYNISRFDQTKVHTLLTQVLQSQSYDIIHFENLFMAPYLKTVRQNSDAKCVLRMHNVEHQIWERLALETKSKVKKYYLNYLAKKLKQYEEKLLPQFDAVIPISEEDLNWAQKQSQKPMLKTPMGLTFNSFRSVAVGKHFFHIGSMEWIPNQQGCTYLVNEIWPKVLKEDPECHLHLAGKGMGDGYQQWVTDNIHIHGEVESAEVFMQSYHAMLIPLKSASGLRIKALEALGLGIPIISTKTGMSGLIHAQNEHFLEANSTSEWVNAIVKLANDAQLHGQLAIEGYTFVTEHYDEKTLSNQLITFYEELIQ